MLFESDPNGTVLTLGGVDSVEQSASRVERTLESTAGTEYVVKSDARESH